MVCGKCKRNNTNIVCYCNSCFQNARLNARQEGRVEGAKIELQKIINLLDRFGKERTPTLSIKRHFEKRLKSLESGKK